MFRLHITKIATILAMLNCANQMIQGQAHHAAEELLVLTASHSDFSLTGSSLSKHMHTVCYSIIV